MHLVFSTKNREPWLADDIRDELHAYLAGIVENQKGTLLRAGSVSDHIHLLVAHPRTCAPSDLVQEIKTGSSKWLKAKSAHHAAFHWQNGYGMFSVSLAHRPAVETYLANQAAHHHRVTFQEEYRRLLRKYDIAFDERFVWDETKMPTAVSPLQGWLLSWMVPRALPWAITFRPFGAGEDCAVVCKSVHDSFGTRAGESAVRGSYAPAGRLTRKPSFYLE